MGPADPEPLRIGEVELEAIKLGYGEGELGEATIRRPGAGFLKVHFADFDLEPGDSLTVSDPEGREVHRYPELDEAGNEIEEGEEFWALSISAEVVVLRLNRSATPQEPRRGVSIDRFTRGYSREEIDQRLVGSRSTCGEDDKRDVACYSSSHPTEFTRSNSVAKLVLSSRSSCTAWRVGPDSADYMFTNEHCITNQFEVNGAELWFNDQASSCGGATASVTKVKGRTFLADSDPLDDALFTVKDPTKISSFGFLELDVRTPITHEEIYLPQHPGGGIKKFGIESDQDAGNVCRVQTVFSGNNSTYECDTLGGSSGSPVLARSSHRALLLHHGYYEPGCPNIGTRFTLIWPQVRPWWFWHSLWGNGGSDQIALWNMATSNRY